MQMTMREKRLYLERDNRKYTRDLVEVPREHWPASIPDRLKYLYRSNAFIAQVYEEPMGFRLSISRTRIKPGGNGDWDDDISWDELQAIKAEVGYGNFYAIEVYPQERNLVNVANMRHLWILTEPLDIGWGKP